MADRTKDLERRRGSAVSRTSKKSHRVPTSSYAGEIKALSYAFDVTRMLNGILEELLYGNIGVRMPTYVRNDNSAVAYQVDSANTATNEKRINGFLESNRDELEQNKWLSAGYIHGDINTSDVWTKSLSSVKLGNLLDCNMFRIVTEERKNEIRRKYLMLNDTLCILKQLRGE